MVFGQGPARLTGRADFLAKPHAATVGDFEFQRVPLDRLQPIIQSYQVTVSSGTLSANGNLEYTPTVQRVKVEEAVIDGVRIDYVSDPELTARAVAAVTDAKRKPDTLIEVGELKLVKSELGFINRARDPDYRVFVTDTDLTLGGLEQPRRRRPVAARGARPVHGQRRDRGARPLPARSRRPRPRPRGGDPRHAASSR